MKPVLNTRPKKFGKLIIALLIFLVIGFGYYGFSGQSLSFDDLHRKSGILLTRRQKLENAIEKTIQLNTLYVEFESETKSTLTSSTLGFSRTIDSNINGYLAGSTDGKISKAEMRVSSDLTKGLETILSVIGIDEEVVYIQGPSTNGKWIKLSYDEYLEVDVEDASLYQFNLLATFFDDSKALIKSVDANSFSYEGVQEFEGEQYEKYTVEISVPKYIETLDLDESVSDTKLAQHKSILESAVISADMYVSSKNGYINGLVIRAKNLEQIISQEDIKNSGISRNVHNITLSAKFSRFNLETNISAPPDDEVINVDEPDVLGVQKSLDSSGNSRF